jgi:hypothetical protein
VLRNVVYDVQGMHLRHEAQVVEMQRLVVFGIRRLGKKYLVSLAPIASTKRVLLVRLFLFS